MKAAIGASAGKRRCRSSLASSRRTTPNSAMSTPATSATRSMRLAIGTRTSLWRLAVLTGLDPKLTQSNVRVDGQMRGARRRVAVLLPVVVGAAARVVEDLRLARRDVSGAGHAYVRRHDHLGLADPELEVHVVLARPEARVAQVQAQVSDTELVVATQLLG